LEGILPPGHEALWAGGKRVEIAFLWGYPVRSTASLCNNGVKKTELDSSSVRMTDRIVEF